jgi:hypothetical protein
LRGVQEAGRIITDTIQLLAVKIQSPGFLSGATGRGPLVTGLSTSDLLARRCLDDLAGSRPSN